MFNPSCGFYNHLCSRTMPYCGVAGGGGATVNGSMANVSKISREGVARRQPPARARYQLFCSVFRSSASHKSIGGRESFVHTRPWATLGRWFFGAVIGLVGSCPFEILSRQPAVFVLDFQCPFEHQQGWISDPISS